MPKSSTFSFAPPLRVEQEKIRRLDVAMRDALLVRDGEALGGGLEERERFFEGATSHAGTATLMEIVGERFSLEPLEDHVRRPRAVRRVHRAEIMERTMCSDSCESV